MDGDSATVVDLGQEGYVSSLSIKRDVGDIVKGTQGGKELETIH
jgi:hypothetical protein